MDTLPPEMKQIVCSNLTPKDLKAVRLTNRDLAAAGACYILPTVYVFNRTESFNELKEIVEHPTFGKHLKTVVYEYDSSCLNGYNSDFELWNRHRSDTCYVPRWVDFKPHCKTGPDGYPDTRSQRAIRRAEESYSDARQKCPISPELVVEMWVRHWRLVEEQNSKRLRELKQEIIALVFRTCPKLEKFITGIKIKEASVGSPEKSSAARSKDRVFKDLWEVRSGWKGRNSSHGALEDFFYGQAATGAKLRHLTILDVSLYTSVHTALSPTALQNLHTARLSFATHWTAQSRPHHVSEMIAQSLGASRHLEILMIKLYHDSRYGQDVPSLAQLLMDFNWPRLHTLTFRDVMLEEEALVAFLLRHRDVLQRLAFSNCRLKSGTWTSLFNRLANKLPNLKLFRLKGLLSSSISRNEYWCPFLGHYTDANTVALQNFVVEGGDFPHSTQVTPRVYQLDSSHRVGQPMLLQDDEYDDFF